MANNFDFGSADFTFAVGFVVVIEGFAVVVGGDAKNYE